MIAQPQIHVRFPRGTGNGSVAEQSMSSRQAESSSQSASPSTSQGRGWRDVNDLSPIEGQVQIFTCVHRNFFTHVMSQALRNAGQGTAVLIVQFFKGGIGQGPDNPTHLSQNLDWVRCRLPHSINRAPEQAEERAAVLELWEFVQDAIESGRYEQVILEELSLAMFHGIVPEAEVLDLLQNRPRHVDIVLMGQQMPEALIQTADQVTKLRNLFNVPLETKPFETKPFETTPLERGPFEKMSLETLPLETGTEAVVSSATAPPRPVTPIASSETVLAKHPVPQQKPSNSSRGQPTEGRADSQDLPVLPGQLRIPGLD